VLFGSFLAERSRPLHLVGSSIGAFRLACLAQRDPLAALDRFAEAYFAQRYPPKPSPELVTRVSEGVLGGLLGATGAEEILTHPWARLHVVTTRARGLLAMEDRRLLSLGLALAAGSNLLSRRALRLSAERVVFHSAGDEPFRGFRDLPTRLVPLTRENLRSALLASGSIPLVLAGARIPTGPAGVYRDGGLVDYHLDLDVGAGPGIVLFPHFYPHIVPGWFDKALRWRRARPQALRRTLLIGPSPDVVERLPGRKIPDVTDFYRMKDRERLEAWRVALDESARMGDELSDLIATGRIGERVQPFH